MSDIMHKGVVICATGSWYDVLAEDGTSCKCRIRGRMRLKGVRSTNPVVVGDEVLFTAEGDDFVIEELSPRRNYIIRRASNLSKESHIIAANIDRAMDASGLSLLGVVPEDQGVIASGNRGTILALDYFGPAAQAYLNIAKRLTGQRIRLLDQVPGKEWKK